MNGIVVAMMVMNWILAESGRPLHGAGWSGPRTGRFPATICRTTECGGIVVAAQL
jgi:hypothetical protein